MVFCVHYCSELNNICVGLFSLMFVLDKNTTKFKEWLGIEQKLIQEVVEVYGYLAYETVREVKHTYLQSLFVFSFYS